MTQLNNKIEAAFSNLPVGWDIRKVSCLQNSWLTPWDRIFIVHPGLGAGCYGSVPSLLMCNARGTYTVLPWEQNLEPLLAQILLEIDKGLMIQPQGFLAQVKAFRAGLAELNSLPHGTHRQGKLTLPGYTLRGALCDAQVEKLELGWELLVGSQELTLWHGGKVWVLRNGFNGLKLDF